MHFNLFEGARRILYSLVGLTLIVGFTVAYDQSPSFMRDFRVDMNRDGDISFLRTEGCGPNDVTHYYYGKNTPGGQSVSGNLCYPTFIAESGERLVRYRVDGEGMMWGNSDYSEEVVEFRNRAEARLELPSQDSEAIDESAGRELWKVRFKGGFASLGAAFAVWLAALFLGWVVRGFLGIPIGKDFRPSGREPSGPP